MPPLTGPRRDTDLPVRIGYLSADFRGEVIGRLLLPVVAAHDRQRFAVRAYALAPPANSDAVTWQWKRSVDEFVELAAEAIAADDLDLLVDLMRHSTQAQPGILRYKPARVIAMHLGYHGAGGLSQVDYKVTDRYADTAVNARWQLEAPLPLAIYVVPMRHVAAAADAGVSRAALGLADAVTVFAAFVGVRKLSPRCIGVWRRILDAIPDAVLAFSPLRDEDRTVIERRVTSASGKARVDSGPAWRRRVRSRALFAGRCGARHDAVHRR
jgi:predicted O-linked N-acetylglucosamine transferase (SPINDLY family)